MMTSPWSDLVPFPVCPDCGLLMLPPHRCRKSVAIDAVYRNLYGDPGEGHMDKKAHAHIEATITALSADRARLADFIEQENEECCRCAWASELVEVLRQL